MKLILLDRDGVINVATPWKFCHRWEDWEWTYRAPEAIKALTDAGYKLVIVTNQNGASNGNYTQTDYRALMGRAEINMRLRLNAVYYWPELVCACFHLPEENCSCRKPEIGFWPDKILPKYPNVDVSNSWMVGDRESDIEFGRRIGLNTAHIPLGYSSLHNFAETLLDKEI